MWLERTRARARANEQASERVASVLLQSINVHVREHRAPYERAHNKVECASSHMDARKCTYAYVNTKSCSQVPTTGRLPIYILLLVDY